VRAVGVGDEILLEVPEGALHARRHYTMTVIPDPQLPLFGGDAGVVLVIVYGRHGRRLRRRRERFRELWRLAARWRELLARRLRHGYVDVAPLASSRETPVSEAPH
jgi:predicted DNA-binding WGR domain protein